jgi:heat shock protein HslJ
VVLAVILLVVAAGLFWLGNKRRADNERAVGQSNVDRMAESENVTQMVGTFAYMADAGLFTDCVTGKRLPVAHEGDNATLERAYLLAKLAPAEPVLVNLYGHVAERPAIDRDGNEEFMIVDRFIDIWPDEDCSKSGVETPLVNTYWKLVELNGAAVRTHPDQREVHVLFEARESKARGFAGCNQFFGNYKTIGDSLRFEPLASTQMACPHLDEESAFLNALGKVTTYSIMGESIKLREGVRVVARFRAVYFE